jgi:hypothetical protein
MAASKNDAPIASAAMVFLTIDVFIVSSFVAPRLLSTAAACAYSLAYASFRVRTQII